MRLFLRIAALILLPVFAQAQLITPAQQAQLDARYRKQDTNIPPSAITGTALTYNTVFAGVVTGSANSLQFAPNGVRFHVVSNTIQRLDTNGVWQAVISGGSLRKVVAGGNSNNNVEELAFSSSQTNVTFGHVVAGSNSLITLQITGAVGPAGQDGIGNLYGARAWSSGLTYQTNTLVTYGNSVFISVAGITNSIVVPPSDPTTWELWLTGGTNGANGVDGTDGIGYTPRGDWNLAGAYVTNDLVRAHDALYGAILNSTNIEPTIHASWTSYWRAVLYDGVDGAVMTATNILVYSGSATYQSNLFIVYNGQTYATLNPTVAGEVPGVSTNFVLAAARGADGVAGADGADGANGIGNMYWMNPWNSGTSYPSNALVTHNRIIYYSKAANTGLDPAFNTTAWGVAAQALDGNGVIGGAWSNSITYTNQELVTRANSLYFSLTGGNVGNDPTNSPAWWSLLLAGANTNSTLVLTNAVSTNALLTLVYTNNQIIGGLTSIPLFVEADAVWIAASTGYYSKIQSDAKFSTGTPVYTESDTLQSVANRGNGVTNGLTFTNAFISLAASGVGATNFAYIQFSDGTKLYSANTGTSAITNEADPLALAALTNYVSWRSNNVFIAGTTQFFHHAEASNILVVGDAPQFAVYLTNDSHNAFIVRLTNINTHANGVAYSMGRPDDASTQSKGLVNLMLNGTSAFRFAASGPINMSALLFGNGLFGNGYVRDSASGATNTFSISKYQSGDTFIWDFAQSDTRSSVINSILQIQNSLSAPAVNQIVFNNAVSNQARLFGVIGTNQQYAIRVDLTNNSAFVGRESGGLYGGGSTNAVFMVNTNRQSNRQSIEAAGQIKTRDAFFTSYSGIGRLTSGVCIVTLPFGMTTTNYHPFIQYIGNSGLVAIVPEVTTITTNAFTVTASTVNATNFHWMIMGEIAR